MEKCVNKNDVLIINWTINQYEPFEVTATRCWERFKLIEREHIRNVHMRFDEHLTTAQKSKLNDYLRQIASNELIESVSIVDYDYRHRPMDELPNRDMVDQQTSAGCAYLKMLNKSKNQSNLKSFTWKTTDLFQQAIDSIDWSVLSQLTCLQCINVDLGMYPLNEKSIRTLVASMPPSLQHINIDMGDNAVKFDWESVFRSPLFLPHLQSFALGSSHVPESLGRALANRNQPRMLRHLSLMDFKDISLSFSGFSLLNSLTSLFLDTSQANSIKFDLLPKTTLPKLRMFKLTRMKSFGGTFNLDSVMLFLSTRPIEWLSINLFLGSEPRGSTARLLSRLAKLKYLYFRVGDYSRGSFNVRDNELLEMFPAACFPELTHLSGVFSEVELSVLLRAAPALRTIYVSGDILPGILAKVGNSCPLIQSFFLYQYVDPRGADNLVMHFPRLKADFEASRIVPSAFQHLTTLHLDFISPSYCSARSMHFLVSKLKRASQLQFMNILKPARRLQGASLLEFLVIRDLPHVCEMFIDHKWTTPALEMFKLPRQRQSSNLKSKYEFVEAAEIPVIDWSKKSLGHIGEIDVYNDDVDSQFARLTSPVPSPVLFAAAHHQKREYLRFRKESDASGLDGRAAFLAAYYNRLTENDKRLLDMWDKGNYDFDYREDHNHAYDAQTSDEEDAPHDDDEDFMYGY